MTDHELLKLAAKAAGIELRWDSAHGENPMYQKWKYIDNDWTEWNPLVDDGEAFRLAAKLKIDIEHQEDNGVEAYQNSYFVLDRAAGTFCSYYVIESSTNEDDYCAAMRRAIVCVAAEIGKRTE